MGNGRGGRFDEDEVMEAVLAEMRRRPERTTSGLVEQQRWFRKLR